MAVLTLLAKQHLFMITRIIVSSPSKSGDGIRNISQKEKGRRATNTLLSCSPSSRNYISTSDKGTKQLFS